jgi:citronellol/citronellal dehydrogenase
MIDLQGKTALVTGATRGIGEAIALKLAAHGINLIILSKDTDEMIKKTKEKIRSFGVDVWVLNIDISDASSLKRAVVEAAGHFENIDILVNNTSATCFEDAQHLLPKQFDVMMATSVRASLFLTQYCLPYLKRSSNPHVINISPPLNMDAHWFKNYLGFSISKYAMSMSTLGMAEAFKKDEIAINSLWPKSTIATQTIKDHFSSEVYLASRKPSIMADALYNLIQRDSKECTGQFFIDEELLRQEGVVDFSQYAVDPKNPLMQALFTPVDKDLIPVSEELFL